MPGWILARARTEKRHAAVVRDSALGSRCRTESVSTSCNGKSWSSACCSTPVPPAAVRRRARRPHYVRGRMVTAPSWSAPPAGAWNSTRSPASPSGGAAPQRAATTWYRLALAYTDMKWSDLAAHSRASIAEALATVTPAPTTATGERPPVASAAGRAVRARIQPATAEREPGSGDGSCAGVAGACLAARDPAAGSAGDPAGTGCPHRAAGSSPRRGEHHRPQARRLPQRARLRGRTRTARGQPARPAPAADAESRQHGRSPGYRQPPGRSTPSSNRVARIRPELTAFFGCPYYAALRPEEAVALRRDGLILPGQRVGPADADRRVAPIRPRPDPGNGTAPNLAA